MNAEATPFHQNMNGQPLEQTATDDWKAGARSQRRSIGRIIPMLFVVIVALITSGWWLYHQFSHVFVSDARIAADMVVISSRVPGWVAAVEVAAGAQVEQAHLLVKIDRRESRLRVEEFQARLASIATHREEILARIRMTDRHTQSQIEARLAALGASRAKLAAAKAQNEFSKHENKRAESLADSGTITRARLEQTRAAMETAIQQVLSGEADTLAAQANLAQANAAREELNVLESQLAKLGPQEQLLLIQRELSALDHEDRLISMPFDGVVDRIFVDVGEYVTPGQRIMMVHDPKYVRIEANIKETDIRFFRVDKAVIVTVDSIPGQTFKGIVEVVGQSATSEFALLPNPNPSGNFTKITQRIPIRIAISQQNDLLKPGMMVELEVRADE